MKNLWKRLMALMLACIMLMSMAACGKKNAESESPTESQTTSTTPTPTASATNPTDTSATTPPATDPSVPTEPATTPTTPTTPTDLQYVSYNASQDAAFLPKDIFSNEMYVTGLVLDGQKRLDATKKTDVGAFVFKGEYGKCYEIKIPAGVPCVVAATFLTNPRTLTAGEYRTSTTAVKSLVQNPSQEVCFMYNCRRSDKSEYLVIYTGASSTIYIGERTIIAQADTQDSWYIPESVGSISSAQRKWTSEEFVDNLYEPVRNRYPDYITRTTIGKDATGKYNMYCYVYEPENYATTIFINGGTHGDEGVGYFALAKVMQLIADATPENMLLYTIRQKVRFIVVPLVNVYSVSTNHSRYNGNGEDLNRNYDDLSQQESQNVMACIAKYSDKIDIAMDFHIANASPVDVATYFNFINYSDNAVANYKTTNHMFHRYRELGYAIEKPDLVRVPGSYAKSDQYFEGRVWNQYGIPTITVEHLTTARFPAEYTDACMTTAVETYMNFIIQNGLFFIQKNEK